jgi:DNA-binding transcriptional ArsR family regulator
MSVYDILSDPSRRRILALLSERDRSAGELGRALSVSQPGVSKHLRILREAGLVTVRSEAQRRVYRLRAEPLGEVAEWLEGFRRHLPAWPPTWPAPAG